MAFDEPAPSVLPVFPLTGCLLLPGNFLPLNVYERRYRNLVEDSRSGAGYIGMIQPLIPMQDNWGVTEPPPAPELYPVGCAGRIDLCEPQRDGRYLIRLRGILRFRCRGELTMTRGYRLVRADYGEYLDDLREPEAPLDPTRLLGAVGRFAGEHELDFDLDLLAALPGVSLLNGLCAALPMTPMEKQALLEAPGPAEREELLLQLMEIGLEPPPVPERLYSPPTLH